VAIKNALSALILVSLSTSAFAAKPAPVPAPDFWIPSIQEKMHEPSKATTKWKRKVASSQTFSESDLSEDYKKLRGEWLKVTTADQLEALLKASYAKYDSYSDDTKYFLTQAHIALPLRGIVWRMRPLFEKGKGKFIGNKSTHVMAVQMLRGVAASLDMALPTDQATASFAYITEPSQNMSTAQQFKSIEEFQNFLVGELSKKLNEGAIRVEALIQKNPTNIFVWDNKMQFGTGTFRDDIQRYSGHGIAEMNITEAGLYKTLHDVLVFCAYDQNLMPEISKKISSHLGHDSVSIFGKEKEDLGITDEERIAILKDATKKGFLSLRETPNAYGASLMGQAYKALVNFTYHSASAYEQLQGKDPNPSMGLNPIHFSSDSQNRLEKGVKNMEAVVRGVTEVRDPISGKSVTVNLPAFYANPPKSLSGLMAVQFEQGSNEKTIRSVASGETLIMRNYYKGRSIGWNNEVWKSYVPSAAGQKSDYMAEARRVIRYSLGTSVVFNLPALFVK
jgi:hypothetical protein